MAQAAISSLVELLGDQLIQKVKFLRGVEGKVESLKAELKRMQSFLDDANKKQFEDKRVHNWISEIREVAQDAEDTIEMFLINVENSSKGLLKRCTSFAKRMYQLDRIGDEIESIRARLDAIDKSRERYGIKDFGEEPTVDSGWRLQAESRRRLSHMKNDEHLVGVEVDVKKLLEESILNEERKGLSIAVLEGMGGIGKSTLAREIYNHCDVVGRFDSRCWVVVSSEFTPQETIKQLIFQMQRSDQVKNKLLKEMKNLEELMKDKPFVQEELKQMLHKQLDGMSYFIVLDDVWEKEHLESLMSAFPNQQDEWNWKVTPDGCFTIKSAYEIVAKTREEQQVVPLEMAKVWKALTPNKAKVTAWRCLRNRLATCDNLSRRNVQISVDERWCNACVSSEETTEHLFLHCPKAAAVWDQIFQWLDIKTANPRDIFQHFISFIAAGKKKRERRLLNALWVGTVWLLWESRNHYKKMRL